MFVRYPQGPVVLWTERYRCYEYQVVSRTFQERIVAVHSWGLYDTSRGGLLGHLLGVPSAQVSLFLNVRVSVRKGALWLFYYIIFTSTAPLCRLCLSLDLPEAPASVRGPYHKTYRRRELPSL